MDGMQCRKGMHMHIAGLFNSAYNTVANIQKAVNAFKSCGIYPYNPDQFEDVDFAPATVIDFPISANGEQHNDKQF